MNSVWMSMRIFGFPLRVLLIPETRSAWETSLLTPFTAGFLQASLKWKKGDENKTNCIFLWFCCSVKTTNLWGRFFTVWTGEQTGSRALGLLQLLCPKTAKTSIKHSVEAELGPRTAAQNDSMHSQITVECFNLHKPNKNPVSQSSC